MTTRMIVGAVLLCVLVLPLVGGGRKSLPVPPQYDSPISIAEVKGGRLIVSDHGQKKIFEIRRQNLELINSFDVEGKPLGVASIRDLVLVGNASRRRVEAYTRAGEKLFDLGGGTMFQQPTDLAVDPKVNRLFVVDSGAKLVRIFDVATGPGTQVGTIPQQGPNPTVLANPTGIAVHPETQQVVVGDIGDSAAGIHPSVRVFDYAGNSVATHSGQQGMMGRRFSRPQGVAINDEHIFLVDSWLGIVLILDRVTGASVRTLGGYGTAPGELSLPLDVHVHGKSDDVFVTNNRLKRIEVFVDGAVFP